MVISYNLDIPDAPNNPSVDQPNMRTNTNSINTIIAVDHYTFADTPSGTHKQVTLRAAAIDSPSIISLANGTANPAVKNAILTTSNSVVLPLNCVRAWGYVQGGVGPVVIASQSVNVSTVTRSSAGHYVITLTANAVSSDKFAVITSSLLASSANGTQSGYQITGVGTFEINFTKLDGTGSPDPANFTFIVLQI